jgi:peroxiredoxin
MVRGARVRSTLLAACLALAACAPAPEPAAPAVGERMPDMRLAGLEGGTLQLVPRAGRVLVLNFWATWCVPCRAEMDSLQRLARDSDASDIEVVGVSVDRDVNLVREHVQRQGWAFARYIDPEGAVSRRMLAVEALPRTYVIGPDGRIAMVVTGARDWASQEMTAALRRLRGPAQRRSNRVTCRAFAVRRLLGAENSARGRTRAG